jgi:hypothetical protein
MKKSQPTNKLIVAGVISVLIVAAFLLFRGCGAMVGDGGTSGADSTDGSVRPPDTVFVNADPDTVYLFDTIVHTITRPVPYEVYKDTTEQFAGTVDCDSTRLYVNDVVGDSGSVSVVSTVKGELMKQDVSMELRTIIITDIDTVRIEMPCPNVPSAKKGQWTIGGAFNSAIQPSVWATYGNNNRAVIGGYNFVDGRIMLGAGISFGNR